MSRVSTFAGSSFSPDRMLRSTTAPVSKFLNLVRVNAAPLPGFTNWNSMTVYGLPSISTLRPLRISDVSYMTRHVYPARSRPVKPAFVPHRPRSATLARFARGRDKPPMDAAAHYRPLLTLGRDEFLAAAAPAMFVRYRLWADPAIAASSRTITLDDGRELVDETGPHGKLGEESTEMELYPLAKKPGASFPDR